MIFLLFTRYFPFWMTNLELNMSLCIIVEPIVTKPNIAKLSMRYMCMILIPQLSHSRFLPVVCAQKANFSSILQGKNNNSEPLQPAMWLCDVRSFNDLTKKSGVEELRGCLVWHLLSFLALQLASKRAQPGEEETKEKKEERGKPKRKTKT